MQVIDGFLLTLVLVVLPCCSVITLFYFQIIASFLITLLQCDFSMLFLLTPLQLFCHEEAGFILQVS